jgi:hypothetical protein
MSVAKTVTWRPACARLAEEGAAVSPHHNPPFFKHIEISSNGNFGHTKHFTQVGAPDGKILFENFEYSLLSFGG